MTSDFIKEVCRIMDDTKRREAYGITAEQEARLTEIEEQVRKLEEEYTAIVNPTPDEIKSEMEAASDNSHWDLVEMWLDPPSIDLCANILASREMAAEEGD